MGLVPVVPEVSMIPSVSYAVVGNTLSCSVIVCVDIQLNLEKKFAEFLNYEEAALYSFGYATVASVIPVYSTRTDTIFW